MAIQPTVVQPTFQGMTRTMSSTHQTGIHKARNPEAERLHRVQAALMTRRCQCCLTMLQRAGGNLGCSRCGFETGHHGEALR